MADPAPEELAPPPSLFKLGSVLFWIGVFSF
jgi:hypothetical protein